MRPDIVERVALRFAALLRQDIGSEKMRRVRYINSTMYPSGGCCASHNFCDANVYMCEAIESLIGREIDVNEAIDPEACALWNSAWALAFDRYLTMRKHPPQIYSH